MADGSIIVTVSIKEPVEQIVRDYLLLNIGDLWDEYCFDKNVPPEIKLHGIEFFEHFAKHLNKEL